MLGTAITKKEKVQSNKILKLKKTAKPYLFLLPIFIFAIGFVYYPFLKTFVYSFCTVNAKGEILGFVWFDNYSYMFSYKNFTTALVNTLKLAALVVPLNIIVTLGLALLATKKRRFSGFYETLFTMPMAISMSAACLIFKILLNPTIGYVNQIFGWSYEWFTDKATAIYAVVLLCLWMGIGFNFILFLSALRGIPQQLMEAAKIDGANCFMRFIKVQLPLITPTLLYVVCTDIIHAMMTSAPMLIITEGGPANSTMSLIYLMYVSGYASSNYSLASCVSIVTFLLTLGFTSLAFVFERKKVHYQ